MPAWRPGQTRSDEAEGGVRLAAQPERGPGRRGPAGGPPGARGVRCPRAQTPAAAQHREQTGLAGKSSRSQARDERLSPGARRVSSHQKRGVTEGDEVTSLGRGHWRNAPPPAERGQVRPSSERRLSASAKGRGTDKRARRGGVSCTLQSAGRGRGQLWRPWQRRGERAAGSGFSPGPAARSGSAARAGIPGAEARWARRDWGGFGTYAGLASRPDCRPQGPESGPKGGVANGIGRVARCCCPGKTRGELCSRARQTAIGAQDSDAGSPGSRGGQLRAPPPPREGHGQNGPS